MRYLLFLSLALQIPAGYPAQMYPSTNGVIIRIDGSVMVDEWNYYDQTPGNVNPNKKYPTNITIGRSIKDPVNICIEFQDGTICQDIGKLRELVKSSSGVKK